MSLKANKTIIIIMVILGFCVFGNSVINNFVWDDRTFLQFNPDINRMNPGYLLGANMFNNINAGQYRFLVAVYFAICHNFFGNNTYFYHVLQISLHIGNTFLIFLTLKKFLKNNLALFLSLIFLVHPMQVESVAYIASIGNPMFTFLGLMALMLSFKSKISIKRLVAIFGLLLGSMLAKETGILFIILVILYRYLFVGKNQIKFVGGVLVTISIYALIRFGYAEVFFSKVTLAPITRLSLQERLINIPAVIFYYLKTFIYPNRLVVEQYWIITQANLQNFYLPLVAEILMGLLLICLGRRLRRTKKDYFFSWVFFGSWLVTGMGMYSQIYSLDMTVADRWFYFPIIGLLGIIGVGIQTLLPHLANKKILIGVIATLTLGSLSWRTINRNSDWKNPVTLYTHDLQIYENYDLENSLGAELNLLGKYDEAMKHFKKSVDLFPHETNLFNLGLSYENGGNTELAVKYYFEALNTKSYGEVPRPNRHHNVTYERLGILLLKRDPKLALEVINNGLQDYPNSAQLWYTKALGEYKNSNYQEALTASKNAYILLPNNTSTKNLYDQLTQNKKININ